MKKYQSSVTRHWLKITDESGPLTLPRGWGQWALKRSLMKPLYFLYFWDLRNKRSHWTGRCCQPAPRLYNSYNLCPCARPTQVGECWPGPEFKFFKTVEVVCSCYLQLCQREIATDEIQEGKNYWERSNIKARVLVHGRAHAGIFYAPSEI